MKIEEIASLLVEPAAGLPGGDEIDIAERIESVLESYPRFRAPFEDAVADLSNTGLADLERERPDLFTPLLEVVVSAWALSEPVWEALGYEGQRDLDPAAHPIPEDLFQPLPGRGPRWRQPPEVTE